MANLAIETANLTKHYSRGAKKSLKSQGVVHALDNMSIQVEAGSIFGFLGTNGAGKTTMIRLLLGLTLPTQGSAKVLGMDVATNAEEIRKSCGALMEHAGLYERLSAYDNLEFYGRISRYSRAQRRDRAEELLTKLSLWDRKDDIVGTWSRGMKQKLAVARALLHHPKLVFLDEPTAGLDPQAAAALHDDLIQLVEKDGVTVFLTTHNLYEVEKLCRQVAVIREGKLLAAGSPETLRSQNGSNKVSIYGSGFGQEALTRVKSSPEIESVMLDNERLVVSLKSDKTIAPIISELVYSGVQIEEVHKEKSSLEDVFLSLVEDGQ